MKTFFLLIACVCFAGTLAAQDSSSTWQAYTKSISGRLNNSYIVYSLNNGGESKQIILCFIEDTMQVVALGTDGKFIKEIQLKQPGLFTLVDENLNELFTLKNQLNNVNNASRKKFLANYNDPKIDFIQVGIRYGSLHYNHFTPKDIEAISVIKNNNIRQAYLVIKQIREVLLKSVL